MSDARTMSDAGDTIALDGQSPEVQVDLVLERAGLSVTDEERARLIRLYPSIRGWTDALRLAETRYAEPALIYPAGTER